MRTGSKRRLRRGILRIRWIIWGYSKMTAMTDINVPIENCWTVKTVYLTVIGKLELANFLHLTPLEDKDVEVNAALVGSQIGGTLTEDVVAVNCKKD